VPRDHPNLVAGIVRFPERSRRRFITTVEMPRFLQALEQEDNDYARRGIWLLLLMGLRCKELLKAKWEDIDWDMGTLFIGLTKNGEPLLAPISDAAMERLKIIPRASARANFKSVNEKARFGPQNYGAAAAIIRSKRTG
jgi:integrase